MDNKYTFCIAQSMFTHTHKPSAQCINTFYSPTVRKKKKERACKAYGRFICIYCCLTAHRGRMARQVNWTTETLNLWHDTRYHLSQQHQQTLFFSLLFCMRFIWGFEWQNAKRPQLQQQQRGQQNGKICIKTDIQIVVITIFSLSLSRFNFVSCTHAHWSKVDEYYITFWRTNYRSSESTINVGVGTVAPSQNLPKKKPFFSEWSRCASVMCARASNSATMKNTNFFFFLLHIMEPANKSSLISDETKNHITQQHKRSTNPSNWTCFTRDVPAHCLLTFQFLPSSYKLRLTHIHIFMNTSFFFFWRTRALDEPRSLTCWSLHRER